MCMYVHNEWEQALLVMSTASYIVQSTVRNAFVCRMGTHKSGALLLTQQTPVVFTQLIFLMLGGCQCPINGSQYGHLHMREQPFYAQ